MISLLELVEQARWCSLTIESEAETTFSTFSIIMEWSKLIKSYVWLLLMTKENPKLDIYSLLWQNFDPFVMVDCLPLRKIYW